VIQTSLLAVVSVSVQSLHNLLTLYPQRHYPKVRAVVIRAGRKENKLRIESEKVVKALD